MTDSFKHNTISQAGRTKYYEKFEIMQVPRELQHKLYFLVILFDVKPRDVCVYETTENGEIIYLKRHEKSC